MSFLKGKTAIITGGGRPAPLKDGTPGSIGYGIAHAYAKEGARWLCNLNEPLGIEEDGTELGELAKSINYTKREQTHFIIQDISYVLGEMAQGNFMVSFDHNEYYMGAYAAILESMQKLKNEQSQTLLQIETAADQVALGSGQVSDGAQALAQGATEQASAVEELSATIRKFLIMQRGMRRTARMALQHSQQVSSRFVKVLRTSDEMVTAMGRISRFFSGNRQDHCNH